MRFKALPAMSCQRKGVPWALSASRAILGEYEVITAELAENPCSFSNRFTLAHKAVMGGDCCAPDSLPAAQHMLNDLHLNTGENEGANTAKAASPKSHQEHAKELEDFIRKRIDLFEQYKAREDAQARSVSP